jgi:hypothetical protein
MAGPFELIQGGYGIAGRLPVFLKDESGAPHYWGIVSVTLDYPAVLETSSMASLESQGVRGRMWRVNPDTGEEQTILETATKPIQSLERDYELDLFNSTWTISLAPPAPWYGRPSCWLCAGASLVLSLLAAVFVYGTRQGAAAAPGGGPAPDRRSAPAA